MANRNKIFVTGGTGNQGGAIVRNLYASDKYEIVVLSRNPKSKKALRLKELGVKVVQGDLNNPNSYNNYLSNVYGVFSVQDFSQGVEKEIAQGIQLADLTKENKIKHLIYSSVCGADLKSGIPHFESKNKIERHIKGIGIPHSIIRPTSFYENLLNPEVKKRIMKGKLVMPIHEEFEQEFISCNDIGIVGVQMFNNPSSYLGKTITIASDKMTMGDLAKLLSRVLGKEIKYQKLSGIITRLVMGKNLHKMFKWINKTRPEFVKNIDEIRREFIGFTNMETWLMNEFKNRSS